MRARLLPAILLTCALAVPGAAGEDPEPADGDALTLEVHRERMEALYRKAESQHRSLRAFADTLRDREPGAWPEPLSSEPARTAVATFVDPFADPGIDRLFPPELLAVRNWPLWEWAVRGRAIERRWASPDAPAVDVFVAAVLDVADLPMDEAWDRHLRSHDVVRAWRRANGEPEPTDEDASELVRDMCRGRLVGLPKGRFEVGPWDGWVQDLTEKQNRRHTVSVGALHVQPHEVTCADWFWFLVETTREDRSALESLLPQGWAIGEKGRPEFPEGRARHPVTGVSFLQARRYAEWLGMRLPTEDEWERIAAAGDPERLYPWGAEVGDRVFGHRGVGDGGTSPVDAFPADVSLGGVVGLAGNVKELVATHPDRKPVKGAHEADDRVVIRGGGFRTRPDECTTRWRWFVEAGAQEPDVGFRCVIDDDDLRRLKHRRRR